MCKRNWLYVMAATTLVVSSLAMAQERAPREGRGMQTMSLADAVKQLDLTAEQKEKAAPILKADAEARQKLMQEMMAARDDQDARAAARRKVQELDAKTKEQLGAVLTKEQTAKVERATGPGGAFDRFVAMVEKVDLTAEQKTQVADAVKAANADAAAKADESGKIYQAATTKIAGLLTDEQKTKLDQMRQAQQF